MNTYYIWAEHTLGESVSHPCRAGAYEDPADLLDLSVLADSEAAAEWRGWVELERTLEARPPCPCGRSERAGTDRWRDSVSVIASRTPYPDYTSD
jgi:hypothetical protein